MFDLVEEGETSSFVFQWKKIRFFQFVGWGKSEFCMRKEEKPEICVLKGRKKRSILKEGKKPKNFVRQAAWRGAVQAKSLFFGKGNGFCIQGTEKAEKLCPADCLERSGQKSEKFIVWERKTFFVSFKVFLRGFSFL